MNAQSILKRTENANLLTLAHEPGECIEVENTHSAYRIIDSLELGSCLEKLHKSLEVFKVQPPTIVDVGFL